MSDAGLCGVCQQPKEPTRVKSNKCRACDGAAKARSGSRQTAHKRLTLELPVDVWDRLDAEARSRGQRIAGFTQALIVARDTKKHGAKP